MRNLVVVKILLFIFTFLLGKNAFSQILGGGTTFSTAVTFSQSWLVNCPSGATSFCNTSGCEASVGMDPCGAAPACVSGTTGSDVWFKFFAQSSTATIVVNATSAFDIALQAFSGSTCAGLTEIGCVDATGNNQTETLNLTGLTAGTIYFFRVFGATNAIGARTGNYTFCGTTGLGSAPLPLTLINTRLEINNQKACIQWVVESEYGIESYDIEYSANGFEFSKVGTVLSQNHITRYEYFYCDGAPRDNGLYRIKINEQDGKISYSPMLRNQSAIHSSVTIFPNPAREKIYIESPPNTDVLKNVKYNVISAQGLIVLQGELGVNRSISIERLLPGSYVIQLIYNDKIKNLRFIKSS